MEAGISALIAKAHDELQCNNIAHAKQCALKASIAIDIEKNKYISDEVSETTEQTLASHYSKIYDLLEEINQNILATKCLYKAMLFDPNWSCEKYSLKTDAVWKKIFRTQQVNNVKRLLSDVAELAKLAENLEKWTVALQIYEDLCIVKSRETTDNPLRGEESLRQI